MGDTSAKKNLRLNRIVAKRRLQVEGTLKPVEVRIGQPRKSTDGDWECSFFVQGITRRALLARGLDGLQSLIMAIEGVRTLLEESGKTFIWEGGELGDTGLSLALPIYFGLEFRRKLEQMVEQEIDRHSEMLEKRSGLS